MNNNTKNIADLLPELDGGTLLEKLERALYSVAEGVVQNDRKGKVTLEFSMERIGNSNQVELQHKLVFSTPTMNGKQGEEQTTSTPLHVGPRGKLTIFPESQTDMFAKDGSRNPS